MSFNRLPYDSCAYAKTLQQSTDPLDYNLFKGKFESCETCTMGSFKSDLDFGVRSEVESDLKGQVRIGTKCDNLKFPTNSNTVAEFTPMITCQSIYSLTPSNLEKPLNNGLKDLHLYGQNSCPIFKK
jgi:hypothetical protein